MSSALNVKSAAHRKLERIKKEGGEIDQKIIDQVQEEERGHDFLNLENKMKDDQGKEYTYDHKKIKEIRERELRALKRSNQYQMAQMKKDEEMNKKLRIIDFWNYKDKFRNINKTIVPRNPFFNKQSIKEYIEVAFEEKGY